MAAYQNSSLTFHEDIDFFCEAVFYTAGRTELNAALIEKDYYCSALLAYLYQNIETLSMFKGGTSRGKIHANFYWLSQDPIHYELSIMTFSSATNLTI